MQMIFFEWTGLTDVVNMKREETTARTGIGTLHMHRHVFFTSTALCLTIGSPALAQSTIDIPAQPLAAALSELANETGLQVVVSPRDVDGKMSKAVSGPMTPKAALREMLSETGLTFRTPERNGAVLSASDTVSQNEIEDEPLDLGTLVLTGELIERTVQESQTSVAVIPGEELDERGDTQLDQTLRRIPGVFETNRIRIRGISDDGGLGNGTNSTTISVTTDGVRLTDFRNFGITESISTWDVEQVEVFRGSQSTQSGRNALAGAIVVEGTKPQFSPEYRVRLGVIEDEGLSGESTRYQAAFVVNTPLVEDQLAFRLSVDDRGIGADRDRRTIRAGLLYEPTDRLSFGLTYTNIDNAAENDAANFNQQKLQSPRLTVDYDITSALTFSSRTQFTDANPVLGLGQAGFASIIRDREYETIDQEFRLIYETENIRAVGGLFYTNIDEFSTADLTIAFLGTRDFSSEDIETENYAIYGEVEYDVSPQWTIIAGLRYDVEEVVNTSTASLSTLGGMLIGSAAASFDNTYDALLPKLGAVYRFDENRTLGLTYQRGYRAGGVGVRVDASGTAFTTEFDPEFTDTIELAYRSQSSDGNRILNGNLFYTNWTDRQAVDQDALGNPIISNTSSAELWGAEFDYRQLFNDNFEVSASAAFVQTRFGNFVVGGQNFTGNSFGGAPEVQASLGASYRFDNGLSIGGDVNYTSSFFTDDANTDALKNDAYVVTNLNATYTFDNGLFLTAYARNLFNEQYTLSRNAIPGLDIFGPDREYGFFVTADF
ncbi:MAG: TonB-dependent receptor [Pseudomonadota bacterium]